MINKIKNRIRYLLQINYKIFFSKLIFYKFVLLRDRIYGVDFYKALSLAEIGLSDSHESIHYGATRTGELNKVLKLSKGTNKDRILDFGSGKGLGLVDFKKFGFTKVSGVELSKDLISVAENNFKKLGLSGINIFNQDATTLKEELDEFNFFYFYNPFIGRTFELVIENIVDSIKRNKREVTIIYNHPLELDKILKTNFFEISESYTSYFFESKYLVLKTKLN